MMHCREVKGCVCVCVCVAAALRDSPGRASGQGEGEQSEMKSQPPPHQHANMRAAERLRVPRPEGGFPGCRHRLANIACLRPGVVRVSVVSAPRSSHCIRPPLLCPVSGSCNLACWRFFTVVYLSR